MGNVPPNEPTNPFPVPNPTTGWFDKPGISYDDWKSILDDWFSSHKAFRRRAILANGQPADGYFPIIWKEVKAVQQLLTQPIAPKPPDSDPDRLARVRKQLEYVIGQTETIENAVCMGLGRINWQCHTDYDRDWVQQCGLFLAICQLLEEKQGTKIKTFFQDPAFETEDRWILDRIGGQRIIEHPAANDMMGKGSFIFAPHFPAIYMFDTFLARGREMDLLLTNTIHGSLGTIAWPIVDHWFKEVYWSGKPSITPKAQEMYDIAKDFLANHTGIDYWGAYSTDKIVSSAYNKLSFYLPKARPSATASDQQVW